MHPELAYLLRILAAAGLAALLGYERERAHKPAGLRTHMLVGIAAALYTSLAELSVRGFEGQPGGLNADPIRAIQAVALGVGFLGGGMIVTRRDGGHVQGLTTAASIWATAAIGIACGFAHYVLAVGATLLLLVVLRVLVAFDRSEGEG
jgi:putative Mg2+ transporter-C (MgtC) family protein